MAEMSFRLRWIFLASVVLVVAAAFAVSMSQRGEKISAGDGKSFRVHDFTYGTVHRPRPFEATFVRNIKDSLRSMSLKPLLASSQPLIGMSACTKNLILWVREDNFPDIGRFISQIEDLEIPLPDGQTLMGARSGFGSRTPDGGVWELATFPIVPRREKKLNVRFKVGEREYQIVYPNPAYEPRLPVWKTQELPITWTREGFSATLQSLDLERIEGVAYNRVRWEVRPSWSFTWNGQRADSWFQTSAEFEDASGNRSYHGGIPGEPAWKLHCTVFLNYAFPASQVPPSFINAPMKLGVTRAEDCQFELIVRPPAIPTSEAAGKSK
jgi:hypothetical protein